MAFYNASGCTLSTRANRDRQTASSWVSHPAINEATARSSLVATCRSTRHRRCLVGHAPHDEFELISIARRVAVSRRPITKEDRVAPPAAPIRWLELAQKTPSRAP